MTKSGRAVLLALSLAACAAPQPEQPWIRVVTLENAVAADVVSAVRAELRAEQPEAPDGEDRVATVVVAHEATNSILVQATPERIDSVVQRIESLDRR